LSAASFTPIALNDLKEAYEFYEAKDHDLALQFMLSVRQTVDAIEKAPLRFPKFVKNVRKAAVKKFPYSVSYIVDGDSIIVACLHQKRDGSKIVLERLRAIGPSPE
jgi:hypothetical protein